MDRIGFPQTTAWQSSRHDIKYMNVEKNLTGTESFCLFKLTNPFQWDRIVLRNRTLPQTHFKCPAEAVAVTGALR